MLFFFVTGKKCSSHSLLHKKGGGCLAVDGQSTGGLEWDAIINQTLAYIHTVYTEKCEEII